MRRWLALYNKERCVKENVLQHSAIYRGYLFFSVKDRNLFHRVDTIGNIFTSGAVTSEKITDGVHRKKNKQIFCLFYAFNPFREKLY